jgi:hypothetical protein
MAMPNIVHMISKPGKSRCGLIRVATTARSLPDTLFDDAPGGGAPGNPGPFKPASLKIMAERSANQAALFTAFSLAKLTGSLASNAVL